MNHFITMNHPTLNHVLTGIGNDLYHMRHSKNEKIETVAKAIGVHHSVISKIEHGRYEGLNLRLLQKLTNYYHKDINITLSA